MHFVYHAKKEKYPFCLATEMNDAEKLDDIVFMFKKEGIEKEFLIFLQAKHIKDLIKISDLESTSEKNNFSLLKYFVSFCKIKSNRMFEGTEQTFFIVTNTDFEFGEYEGDTGATNKHRRHDDFKRWANFFAKQQVSRKNEFLFFDREDFQANERKFNLNSSKKFFEEIKKNLLTCAMQSKEILDISMLSDVLKAIQFVHFKNLIEKASNAVANITNAIKNKKIEIVFKNAEQVRKLKGNIFDDKFYYNLEIAIDKLKEDKEASEEEIKTHMKTILDEICIIERKAVDELEENESILEKFYEQKQTLENLKQTLKLREENLKREKNEILDLDEESLKTKIKCDNLKEKFPKKLWYTYNQKQLNLDERKEDLCERLDKILAELSMIQVAISDDKYYESLKDFTDQFSFVTKFPKEEELGDFVADELNEMFFYLDADLIYASFEKKMLDFFKDYSRGQAKYLQGVEAEFFFDGLLAKVKALLINGFSKAYTDKLRSFGISYKNNLEELLTFLSKIDQIFYILTESTRLSAIKVLQTLTTPVQPLTHEGQEQIIKLKRNNNNFIFIRLRTLLRDETQKEVLKCFRETHNLMVIECQSKDTDEKQMRSLFRELKRIQEKHPTKKLIVIASNSKPSSYLSNSNLHECHDESSFSDLDETSQARILGKEIDFQGKNVPMGQLIDASFAAQVFSSGKTLTKLLDESFSIGNRKSFSSSGYIYDYYIPRKLSSLSCRNSNDLLQKIVLITGDSGEGKSTLLTSVARTIKKLDVDKNCSFSFASDNAWIVRVNLNDYGIMENSLSLGKIQLGEGSETEDAVNFLKKIAVPNDTNTDPAIIELQRTIFFSSLIGNHKKMPKIILLFDGFDETCPQFEKETTNWLKALANSQVTQMYVTTRINKKTHLERELDSPAYILKPLSPPEQKQFISECWKWNLKYYTTPCIDEVCERSSREIRENLEQIRKSTDPDLAQQIAHILNIFPEETDFESNYNSLEKLRECIDDLDFEEYMDIVLDHWRNSIYENQKFTVIPLHLKMLTEVVLKKMFPLPKELNLSNLFDEFIKIKFDVYYIDKCKREKTTTARKRVDNSDLNILKGVHNELAARIFFHQEIQSVKLPALDELERFRNGLEKGETLKEELLRVGLLTPIRNQFGFIHRSFAEHFMSKYLINNLTNIEVQKLLIDRIFNDSEYELICKFFNDDLKRNPTKIDTKLLPHHINCNLNSPNGGKNFFHKLTEKDHDKIVELLLKNAEHDSEALENLLTKSYRDEITPIFLATCENQSETAKILLKYSLKLDNKVLKNQILKWKTDERSILIMAAAKKRTTLEVILTFLHENQEYLTPEFLTELILLASVHGTALHSAVDENSENVKILLIWVEQQLGIETLKDLISSKNNRCPETHLDASETVLHRAFSKRDENSIATIFETIEKNYDKSILRELILQTNNFGETLLIKAIIKNRKFKDRESNEKNFIEKCKKVINLLLERIKKLNDLECIEDLAVISVYGDFEADPKFVADKLLEIIDKSTENDQIQKILLIIKSHMDEVQMTAKNLILSIHEYGKQDEMKKVLDKFKSQYCDSTNSENICRIGVKALAITSYKENDSVTVLYEAVECNRKEFVQILLNLVKDFPRILERMVLKIKNYEDETFLHIAGWNGRHEIVSMVLTFLKEKSEILTKLLPSAIRSTKYHMSGTNISEYESENYHKTIQVFLKFVLDNIPKLMVKIVEKIGGVKEALNWAEENQFTDLKNWLDQYDKKNVLFQIFENGNIVDSLEQLDVQEHLLEKNEDGYTLLDIYVDNTLRRDDSFLKYICKDLEKNPNLVRKVFLEINISSAQNIHFLSWIKDNLEDKIPGILKEVLLLRFYWGKTALSYALWNSRLYNAKEIFNWVEEKCDTETFTDLLLATDYHNRTILHSATFDFDLEQSGERMKFLLDSLEDHPYIITKLILKANIINLTALEEIEKEMQRHSPSRENVEKQFVLKELKTIYDKTASSILNSDTNMSIFDSDNLNVLKAYVKNSYAGLDKKEILREIDKICNERSRNKFKNCIDVL